MAPPIDEKFAALSRDVIKAFDDRNGGLHAGYRPGHAKGILLAGTFTPSPSAASLSRAPHLRRASTPVNVRFSDGGGIPDVPDNAPGASPRGMATRFHLAEHVHTDIIAHSVDAFPVRTAEELLEFLRAANASGPGASRPTPIEEFLGTHPAALQFVQAPKPIPASFAKESFFAVNAYKFTNDGGVSRYGRYRIRPEGGTAYLDDAAAAAKSANFLMDEIEERLTKGPVEFEVVVQVAAANDVVDDSTIHWPEDREEVEFGTIRLAGIISNNEAEQRQVIFDPIPRVDGIEPSGDPLTDPRSAIYLMSGRRRRSAAP